MKWLPITSLFFVVLMAVAAKADSPTTGATGTTINISSEGITPTPEMWLYEQQLRNYNDPKMMARQKAEFRSAERQRRMTMLKWYGMSNSRPRATTDPVYNDYSPAWASGNPYFPFRWTGFGTSAIVVRSESPRQAAQ